ncbi:hypothetical protein SUGI_0332060 [Cryptomeria japonica]|nr:hypothetical protein SUGI_0332060 [Cryptomeria japonica]
MIGDVMRRGVSGGQKKRVTTGEMIVGAANALLMDEISTGLDSSTTFQIVKCLRQYVHVFNSTMVVSLLQPASETYDLFDDVILLSEGYLVYQGPRESILEFFDSMGFRCPDRKGVADFLQEVTSLKDQEQYWADTRHPYRFVTVKEFSDAFQSFHVATKINGELSIPYDKSKSHPAALTKEKFGLGKKELLKACMDREILLMKKSSFIYILKSSQITLLDLIASSVFFRTNMHERNLDDGSVYFSALFFGLIQDSSVSNGIYNMDHFDLLYHWFHPKPTEVFSTIVALDCSFSDSSSPEMILKAVNEFLASRWQKDNIGVQLMRSRGLFSDDWWYWLSIGALCGYNILFNVLYTAALHYLDPLGKPQALISKEELKQKKESTTGTQGRFAGGQRHSNVSNNSDHITGENKGMVLPFQPLAMAFDNINYYVDMPVEMKIQGVTEEKL